MMSWTLRFILDQSLKQWQTERKRGEEGNTKIWISWERKELFGWNKKHFSYFLKGYHLMITTCSPEFCRYITQRILMEQNKLVVNEFIFNCGILQVKKGNYFLIIVPRIWEFHCHSLCFEIFENPIICVDNLKLLSIFQKHVRFL